MDSNNTLKRVILWANPRSISTAFARCMENIPNTKIFMEPYSGAYRFGPVGRQRTSNEPLEEPESTFQSVKDRLETTFENYDLIFVKDMGYTVDRRYDMIARGYQHTFLIRHPAKAFCSLWKVIAKSCMIEEDVAEAFIKWLPEGYCYQELFNLYEYLVNSGETPPMIIDADDLVKNPEAVMRYYCHGLGVHFDRSYLNWGVGSPNNWEVSKHFLNPTLSWFHNSLKAGGFKKNVSATPSMTKLPNDLVNIIETSLPYYEKLYKRRIVIGNDCPN